MDAHARHTIIHDQLIWSRGATPVQPVKLATRKTAKSISTKRIKYNHLLHKLKLNPMNNGPNTNLECADLQTKPSG